MCFYYFLFLSRGSFFLAWAWVSGRAGKGGIGGSFCGTAITWADMAGIFLFSFFLLCRGTYSAYYYRLFFPSLVGHQGVYLVRYDGKSILDWAVRGAVLMIQEDIP